jgi:hypothetical protein
MADVSLYQGKDWSKLASPWSSFAEGAVKGYEQGQKWTKQKAERDYATAIAEGPESVDNPIEVTDYYDTEQSKMLEGQAQGIFDDSEQSTPAYKSEQEAQQSTKRQEQRPEFQTTKDWAGWEKKVMDAAKGMGPDAVLKAQQHIVDTQRRGFDTNAQRATYEYENGNMMAAKEYAERAYSYFPDGNRLYAEVVKDPKTGKDMLLGHQVDEETGKTFGVPIAITPKMLQSGVGLLDDDNKWVANRIMAAKDQKKAQQEWAEFQLKKQETQASIKEKMATIANMPVKQRAELFKDINTQITNLTKELPNMGPEDRARAIEMIDQYNQFRNQLYGPQAIQTPQGAATPAPTATDTPQPQPQKPEVPQEPIPKHPSAIRAEAIKVEKTIEQIQSKLATMPPEQRTQAEQQLSKLQARAKQLRDAEPGFFDSVGNKILEAIPDYTPPK